MCLALNELLYFLFMRMASLMLMVACYYYKLGKYLFCVVHFEVLNENPPFCLGGGPHQHSDRNYE